MNILTIFFILLRIISNPLANVFQKKLSQDVSSFVINFYSYLILSICALPFIHKYLFYITYTNELIFLILIAGFLCAMGTVCLIKAVNIGELSVLGPINSYKSVIGLISSMFLLKEIPSIQGILGIIFIIFGSKFIFNTQNEGFSIKILKRKDIQLRFLALVLTGIEAALLKQIIILTSTEACLIFWCLSGLFWSLIFILILRKNIIANSKHFILYLILISLFLGLMQYSTNYVFAKMNVGYALALFQLSSIVTVIFGCKFFNENQILSKLSGCILMILGSVLIILF